MKYTVNLIIFLSILISGSVLVKNFGDDLFLIGLFLTVLYLFAKCEKNIVNIPYYFILVFMIFLHSLFFLESAYAYIGLLLLLTTALLLSNVVNANNFWLRYVKIMYFISVASLIGFITINSLPESLVHLVSTKFILKDLGADSIRYHNLFFINWPYDHKEGQLIRNASIFWEPGAYQFFINLALILNIRLSKSVVNKYNIIFVVCVLTTFSTTGYLVLLLILMDQLFSEKYYKSRSEYLFYFLLFIFAAYLLFNSSIVQDKFGDNNIKSSFALRLYDQVILLSIFFENIFFGIGYGSESIYYIQDFSLNNYGLLSRGGSNSFLRLYVQFGILISTLYFSPLLYRNNGFMNLNLTFLAIILIWLSTEFFVTAPIFIFLLFIRINRLDYSSANNFN